MKRACNKPSSRRALTWGMIAVIASGALVGCRGERTDNRPRQFFPDLDDQPKYKAQSKSHYFADGRSMRDPVRGTVPFGSAMFTASFGGVDFARRDQFLKDDARVFTGQEAVLDADGNAVMDEAGLPRQVYVERTPIEELLGLKRASPGFSSHYNDFLALGEKKFNTFCLPCHGMTGDGKGTVGTRWSYPLPSWHDPQYHRGGEKGSDGLVFHTIRYGVANVGENVPYPLKMPAYASKITEREAWAIVEYYRVLQKAGGVPIQSVPERDRQDLERRRGASPQADARTDRKEGSS